MNSALRHGFAATLAAGFLATSLSAQSNTFPASGNVGIGTTQPDRPLAVVAPALGVPAGERRDVAVFQGWSANCERLEVFLKRRVAGGDWQSADFLLQRKVDFTPMGFVRFAGFDTAIGTGESDYLTVKNGGNVGIGTTAPAGRLDIRGTSATNAYTAPADQADLRILSSANRSYDGGIIQLGGSWGATGYIKTAALNGNAGALVFGTRLAPNDATMQPVMTMAGTYVGVGTTSPAGLFDVANVFYTAAPGTFVVRPQNSGVEGGEIQLQGAPGRPTWTIDNYAHKLRLITSVPTTDNSSQVQIFSANQGVSGLYVQGNVGIGTTNPTNKLEVAGTIRAKEVIVETTGWSDYVFAPDYRLAPLAEVEAHIAAKGTLPGIPSAAEVATQGVSVGDMQAKLLAKVEELTLHLI